jgi:hypothetical protein
MSVLGMHRGHKSAYGQVPTSTALRDAQRALRGLTGPAIALSPLDRMASTAPITNGFEVVKGLGLEPRTETSVAAFLEKALGEENEARFRANVFTKYRDHNFAPELRAELLHRAVRLYRWAHRDRMTKAAVLSIEQAYELKKAVPRGGEYFRRVTGEDGRHQYFYSEAEYDQAHGHVSGKVAARAHLKTKITDLITGAGSEGVELKAFKNHVRRHGADTVAEVLKELGAEHRKGRVFSKGLARVRHVIPPAPELFVKAAPPPAELILELRPAPTVAPDAQQLFVREEPKSAEATPSETPAVWRPFGFRS